MTARDVLGAVAAIAAVGALAGGSHLRLAANPADDAMLRIAWSARPERVERCRAVSEDELASMPAHMRQAVVCEGTSATYRVEVRRNGRVLASEAIRGGGLRRDRQLYHFRELMVPAGPAELEVRLTRSDPGMSHDPAGGSDLGAGAGAGGHGDVARDQRDRRRADELPPSVVHREAIVLQPREVLLVTYDRESRTLRSVRGGVQ